jgi:cytochrome c peroxidase
MSSCREDYELPSYEYQLDIPSHFPEMDIPTDNPITPAKIKLGKLLFEDVRLSRNNTISCASCHSDKLAFSDTGAVSFGLDGLTTKRNSPPLFNLGYHPYFFKTGGAPTLEIQVISPIEDEVEMDMNIVEVCDKLNEAGDYKSLSNEVFGTDVTPFVVSRSLATYLRTLVSGSSRFDDYINGNENAITSTEKAGYELFAGKANCISCHNGFDFTNYAFENNGIYENYLDGGRKIITGLIEDEGKFKVPSLRNLSYTGPYMFDGSIETLEDVIEHYNSGGSSHMNKSDKIEPLNLSTYEKELLLAFLLSLNDSNFVSQ